MILDSFRQDVRVGLRMLFKEKAFCFLAVLVLGLGIGGATTQFTVVNAIMLRGFSFPHPEQLVGVGLIEPKATDQVNSFGAGQIPTAQDYGDIKAAQKSFTMKAGYLSGSTINVTYKNTPQRYTGGYVTEDMFKIVGVSPAKGRDFNAEDNKPGAEKTVILGDEIWRRDFNADPNILGQSVRVNSKAATIIGVMPPGFKFPFSEELWTPLYNEFPPTPRGGLFLGANNRAPAVLGRLKPGVTLDQANAEMIAIARHLAEDNPKTNQNFTSASVQPLLHAFTGVQLRQIVWAMLAAVILVLLIACVNVMNMQFGRAALRAKELAIRGALGATRWRLVRQMLTESLVVAILGAIAGTALAFWGCDMFEKVVKAAPFPPPYWWKFTIDARALIFTRAVRALRNNPQFEAAAMTDRFRMTFAPGGQYEIDGQIYQTDRDRPRGNFESVSDGYFTTLGIKVREGRDFTLEDSDAKQPVAIVNASFAHKYWGNQSALGHQVRIFNPAKEQPWRTIVGVVPDTLMQGPFDQQTDAAGFYMPLLGASPATQFATLVVRPRAGVRADTLGPVLSKAVAELDSNLPTYFAGTPAQFHNDILSGNRTIATLFTIFGIVAFILSGVGLYGVMSFSVSQRTREFGIRMALGADAKRILRMVMSQGAWQLAIGLILGAGGVALLLGVVAAAALKNILFKVNPLDPTIYFAVAGMLTLVAALSCFLPARRATRVDPIVALRYE